MVVLHDVASKELELLPLESELSKKNRNMLVGCYRQLSAPENVLASPVLITAEIQLTSFAGRVKLCPTILKKECDSLNSTQLMN